MIATKSTGSVGVGRMLAAAAGLALLGSGCGVGDALVAAVNDATNQLIGEALKSVQEGARAAGGDAIEVGPEGAELAFDDAAHPLHRTKVVIPAGALPAGVGRAVLSIVPEPEYAVPGTEWTAVGPTAQIRLQSLPDLGDVELVTAATVQVPVTMETEDEPALAHEARSGLRILDEVAADEGAVAGLSTSFSPFVAVVPAPAPDQPADEPQNTLTYAVSQTGATVCSGGAFAPTVGTHEAWLSLTGSGLTAMDIQFVVNSGGEGEVGFFGMDLAPQTHAAGVFPIHLSRSSFSGIDQWVYCGGSNPAGAFNYDGSGSPLLILTLMSFDVTGTTSATDCGDGGQACTRSFGTLWYRVTMTHDDSNDPTYAASAGFDGVIHGARWETAP